LKASETLTKGKMAHSNKIQSDFSTTDLVILKDTFIVVYEWTAFSFTLPIHSLVPL